MKTVTVHAGGGYDVLIERGLLEDTGHLASNVFCKGKVAIITDDIVAALYLPTVRLSMEAAGFSVCTHVFPHGEDSKSHETLVGIYSFLTDNNLTRSDFILALGGGVVGDIAGYAAATYLRGLRFIQIPTTFLAAVDSSVGGKTAVNLPAGKNLVGAFHQPSLVICDTKTFDSLSPDIFADGAAETIKHGLIRDSSFFTLLENGGMKADIDSVVARNVEIKKELVEQDEKDTGQRMLLNFGHTLGHAIEKETGHRVTHGHAIAMGMVLIEEIGERLGINSHELTLRTAACLNQYNLPTSYPGEKSALVKSCLLDKKRTGDTINLIFVTEPGSSIIKPMNVGELASLL